mgnify:CR=1 FL=1
MVKNVFFLMNASWKSQNKMDLEFLDENNQSSFRS